MNKLLSSPASHIELPASSRRRTAILVCLTGLACLIGMNPLGRLASAQTPPQTSQQTPNENPQVERTLYVPFEDLDILFEGSSQHVYLTRDEYNDLLRKSRKKSTPPAPRPFVYSSAAHSISISGEWATIETRLKIETLEDQWHAVPIPFRGMFLQTARLADGSAVPLGENPNGQTIAFLQGRREHELVLMLTAPVQLETVQQSLAIQLPPAASRELNVTVNGNVELASGAAVLQRQYEANGNRTRFQLVAPRDSLNLIMSVNNKTLQQKNSIVAKSVFIHELTSNYQQIHARVNVEIQYGAIEEVRFAMPDEFQIREVTGSRIAGWSVEQVDESSELVVRLRESVEDFLTLNLAAISPRIDPAKWELKPLQPLGVSGSMSVVGIVAEERFELRALNSSGLIPIDNDRIRASIPETVFKTSAGAPAIETVAAFYAPDARFSLTAEFDQPAARLQSRPTSILFLSDRQQKLIGQYQLTAQHEKVISFDLEVPAGWRVTSLRDRDGQAVPFQRISDEDNNALNVRIPGGLATGTRWAFVFEAEQSSAEWTANWLTIEIGFPRFDVSGADFETGAIAVAVEDDLVVRPVSTQSLETLLKDQRSLFGLEGFNTSLTLEIVDPDYAATLAVERLAPQITATTYNFFRLLNQQIAVNYELAFEIQIARSRQLEFAVPLSTPRELRIVGLDGVRIVQTESREQDQQRIWTVELAEPSLGEVRLAIDFVQPLATDEPRDYSLPLIEVLDAEYQTTLVAVEGNPDFDIQLDTTMRAIDIGEMGDAQFVPGPRLLGAFSAAGAEAELTIDVDRRNLHSLPTTIVQSAVLRTLVSRNGKSQTVATYRLRTRAPYLELELPESAEIWGAQLDGVPTRPQVRGSTVLISLPPDFTRPVRQLSLLYEDPIRDFGITGQIDLAAPRLLSTSGDSETTSEIPQADFSWQLTLPSGYTLTSNRGTVFVDDDSPVPLPFESAGRNIGEVTGLFLRGLGEAASILLPQVQRARGSVEMARSEDNNAYYMAPEDAKNEIEEFAMGGEKGDLFDQAKQLTPEAPGAAPTTRDQAPQSKAAETTKSDQDPFLPPAAPNQQSTVPEPGPGDAGMGSGGPSGATSRQADDETSRQRARLKKWLTQGMAGLTVNEEAWIHEDDQQSIQLSSLGNQPRLAVTIVDGRRFDWLAFAYAGLIVAIGLFLCRSTWSRKLTFLMLVILIAAIVPLLGDWTRILWNGLELSLYAVCLLTLFYVAATSAMVVWRLVLRGVTGLGGWLFGRFRSRAAASLGLILLVGTGNAAMGQQEEPAKPTAGETADQRPIEIPSEAIIVPYNPENPEEESDQIFVPYTRYLELMRLADPAAATVERVPPAQSGWISANYQATLGGDELTIDGTLVLECLAAGPLSIPLDLQQAVLIDAQLDGQPARIEVTAGPALPPTTTANQMANQTANQMPQTEPQAAVPPPRLVLICQGPGTRTLQVKLRMPVSQSGVWKQVAGRLPATPASEIQLRLPNENSALTYRLGEQVIRFAATPEQDTAVLPLGPRGQLSLSWREQVDAVRVDQNLSLQSTALFDVRNDGLHLIWNLDFRFRGERRSQFSLEIPAGYAVARLRGNNLRGWEVTERKGGDILDVTLLSEAEGQESFTVELSNRELDLAQSTTFSLPAVVAPDAAIHSGQITVRKSNGLDLQTDTMIGISRIDIGEARKIESPTELLFVPEVFQAFEFSRTPYAVEIRSRPQPQRLEVKTRSIVDIRQKTCGLDSQINLSTGTPIHELTLQLPGDLEIQQIEVPVPYRQAKFQTETSQTLKLFLSSGLSGEFAIQIAGRLSDHDATGTIPLPMIKVTGAVRQSSEIAAIADPELIIAADSLSNCQSVLLSTVTGWLNSLNRERARIAITCPAADFDGNLTVTRKAPTVSVVSVSNVNVTLRSIEESMIISFEIRDAGVDRLSFLLPTAFRDARLRADLLREKTITPVGDPATATQYRVTLQLQDYVMGQYRVLLERDRGLSTSELQVPLPGFEDGLSRVDRFATLQNSGFDELLVREATEVENLDRRQKAYRDLRDLIGGADFRQGYVVKQDATAPVLSYQTNPRQRVETVGASIGLSEIEMTLDRSGGYRAQQKLYLDNRTEPFLEIELPASARLWTVLVAGEPVKPIAVAGDDAAVRIPLIKTADGDSDFLVEIKYGGSIASLEHLSQLSFPFTRTRNIDVASSNVKLNLPPGFDFWWFDGTLGVSEEQQIEQARDAYQAALYSKLQSQAKNSKNELVRQRAAQNLSLLNDADSGRPDAETLLESAAPEIQVDNREQFNSVFEGQRTELFGNSGNVANSYGGNFILKGELESTTGETRAPFNEKWFDSNQLVNPKVLEQNRTNNRFQTPAFDGQGSRPPTAGKDGLKKSNAAPENEELGKSIGAEFERQVVENLNVLQEQSQKAQSERASRGGNSKAEVLRKYRSQLSNREAFGRRGNWSDNQQQEQQSMNQMPANDPGMIQQLDDAPFQTAPNDLAAVPSDGTIEAARTSSLDVSLMHRGRTFLFQAPSGELELNVTVVSQSVQKRWMNFLVLLGVAGLLGCLLWLTRRSSRVGSASE